MIDVQFSGRRFQNAILHSKQFPFRIHSNENPFLSSATLIFAQLYYCEITRHMEPVSRSERIFQGRAYVRHLYRGRFERIEHI